MTEDQERLRLAARQYVIECLHEGIPLEQIEAPAGMAAQWRAAFGAHVTFETVVGREWAAQHGTIRVA